MIDDSRHLLDSILCDWHQWARGYSPVASHRACAMFAGVKSNNRSYDSEDDVTDAALHNATMKAVDFIISELPPMQRTALGIQARNLHSGCSVWSSARLPADIAERALILAESRAALTLRLMKAGVL